jgi:phosphoribosylformimino-5-aminoimidazole carboxamide ribonucleotide (ProFAR) isomerase
MSATVESLTARTSGALEAVAVVAGTVEDEWQYVTDLVAAWSARLATVGSARLDEMAPEPVESAVDRVIEEALLVTDPHRAIDWLSTLSQVVLVALDERG